MKALVYQGPEKLALARMPMPQPVEGEVLVRVSYVGICGSDMHAYLGHDERRPAPLILGHEAAGLVEGGALDGTRVTINPLVNCQKCADCRAGRENLCCRREIISMPPREGAFAPYVSIPERNLVEVSDGFPLDKASLCEPLACGWHAVQKGAAALEDSLEAARALVIGGGAIGVGAALALRAQGCPRILLVEPHAERRAFIGRNIGLEVVHPGELRPQDMFHIVIDGVGFEATRTQASKSVRPGGVIAHIGLGSALGGLDIRRMTLQEITFIGTYTYTREDFRRTAQAMFAGELGDLDWFESCPLAEGAEAFARLRSGAVVSPKIILKP